MTIEELKESFEQGNALTPEQINFLFHECNRLADLFCEDTRNAAAREREIERLKGAVEKAVSYMANSPICCVPDSITVEECEKMICAAHWSEWLMEEGK